MKNPLFEKLESFAGAKLKTTVDGKKYYLVRLVQTEFKLNIAGYDWSLNKPHLSIYQEQASNEDRYTGLSCFHFTQEIFAKEDSFTIHVYFDRGGHFLDCYVSNKQNLSESVDLEKLKEHFKTVAIKQSFAKIAEPMQKIMVDAIAVRDKISNLINKLEMQSKALKDINNTKSKITALTAQLKQFQEYDSILTEICVNLEDYKTLSIHFDNNEYKLFMSLKQNCSQKISEFNEKIFIVNSEKNNKIKNEESIIVVDKKKIINNASKEAKKIRKKYIYQMKELNKTIDEHENLQEKNNKDSDISFFEKVALKAKSTIELYEMVSNKKSLMLKHDFFNDNDLLKTQIEHNSLRKQARNILITFSGTPEIREYMDDLCAISDRFQYDMLYAAIKKGSISALEKLFKAFPVSAAHLNLTVLDFKKGCQFKSVLSEVYKTNLENKILLMRFFLEKGASADGLFSTNGKNLLMQAATDNDIDSVNLLLDFGADPNIQEEVPDMIMSIDTNRISSSSVSLITQEINDLHNRTPENKTALIYACHHRSNKVISRLLELTNIDVTLRNKDGLSALFVYIDEGRDGDPKPKIDYNLAEKLYYLGKSTVKLDSLYMKSFNGGVTLLMVSCERGTLDTVKFLLQLGADINKGINLKGYIVNSLHTAYRKCRPEIFQYLLTNPSLVINKKTLDVFSLMPMTDSLCQLGMLEYLQQHLKDTQNKELSHEIFGEYRLFKLETEEEQNKNFENMKEKYLQNNLYRNDGKTASSKVMKFK